MDENTNLDFSVALEQSFARKSAEEISQSLHLISPDLRKALLSQLVEIQSARNPSDAPDSAALRGEQTVNDTLLSGDSSSFCEVVKDSVVGPYRLLEKIGEGGMGTVWRSQQTHPIQRELAVKVIRTDRDQQTLIRRFKGEQQVLALLNHPNIARIVDAGQTSQGRLYFAMELVEGQPLTSYCDQHRLSVKGRLRIFLDVCDAIQHAHQKGIIHRDLKPTNILVSEIDGRVVPKVIDFGLAKILEEEHAFSQLNETVAGQLLGTLRYMSPEQAGGRKDEIDSRADIYSLGVILYEMLTGETPLNSGFVKRASLADVLDAIRQLDPKPPSIRLAELATSKSEILSNRDTDHSGLHRILTNDLDWISMKALDKDIERRYASVSELGNDLKRFLNGEPVSARPASRVYITRKFIKKNRGIVLALCAVGLALVLGIAGTSAGWQRASKANALANQRLLQVEEAQEKTAERAEGERKAKLVAEKQLSQIRRSNRIMTEIFADLDIDSSKTKEDPLEARLAKRLVKAAEQLNSEEIGGSVDDVVKMEQCLAAALRSLGFPNEALTLNRKAYQRNQDSLGKDHWVTGRSGKMLADALIAMEKLQEAMLLYENYLHVCLVKHGVEHQETLSAMHAIANLALKVSDPEKAIRLLEQVVPARSKLLGKESERTITSMNVLATAYSDAGRPKDAIKAQKEVVRSREKKLGLDAMPTLIAMNNLAVAYKTNGQYADATKTLEQAVHLMKQRWGEEHPNTQALILNLANYYIENNDAQNAIEMLQTARRLLKQRLGDTHPHTMTAEAKLAFLFLKENPKQGEASLKIFERLYQTAKQEYGASHQFTPWHIGNFAVAHARMGNVGRALELSREKVEICRNELGADNPTTLNAVLSLVGYLEQAGQYEDALNQVTDVCQIASKFDQQNELVIEARKQRAEVLQSMGRYDEALSLWSDLLSQSRDSRGDSHATSYQLMTKAAQCYAALHQWGDAIRLYGESLEHRRNKSPDHWRTHQEQLSLGLALLEDGRFDRIQGILESAVAVLVENEASVPHYDRPNLEKMISRIVELYREFGDMEKADHWQNYLDEYLNAKDQITD